MNTTSVYTPATIFPMLPERLSTDLTSLADQQDAPRDRRRIRRLARRHADGRGRVRGARHGTARSWPIPSVGAWLAGQGPLPEAARAAGGMDAQLRLQDRIAQAIGRVRHEHGALEFETPEVEPRFDGDTLSELRPESPNRATSLIENLMIAANGVVARFLDAKGRRVDPARGEGAGALGADRRARGVDRRPPARDARFAGARRVPAGAARGRAGAFRGPLAHRDQADRPRRVRRRASGHAGRPGTSASRCATTRTRRRPTAAIPIC